jgi:hypothetical protein
LRIKATPGSLLGWQSQHLGLACQLAASCESILGTGKRIVGSMEMMDFDNLFGPQPDIIELRQRTGTFGGKINLSKK